MTLAAVSVAVLAFYAAFYRRVVRRWGPVVEPLVQRMGLASTRSALELEAIGKLAAAGVAQALFAAALLSVAGIDLGHALALRPGLVALGAALGIGELGVASFLGTALVAAGGRVGGGPAGARAWAAQARGGWMGLFSRTLAAAPAWLAVASVALYVAGEELVFRVALIGAGRGAGAVAAVGLSALLFVAAQAFNMPSARAAAFPMIGAAVVGLVHGVLFWQVPDALPLVAAHLTYFAGALALLSAPPPAVDAVRV
jgi:CAAX prenyl protease-like protein